MFVFSHLSLRVSRSLPGAGGPLLYEMGKM